MGEDKDVEDDKLGGIEAETTCGATFCRFVQ